MKGVAGLAIAATLLLAGCGDSEKFSDAKIADAIGAEDDAVGGDPFCVIADYLNDSDQIDKADKKGGAVITSAQGNVGVVVEPPFPSDCEQKVRKGLSKLDPKKQDE
jgi:hypothetical protein